MINLGDYKLRMNRKKWSGVKRNNGMTWLFAVVDGDKGFIWQEDKTGLSFSRLYWLTFNNLSSIGSGGAKFRRFVRIMFESQQILMYRSQHVKICTHNKPALRPSHLNGSLTSQPLAGSYRAICYWTTLENDQICEMFIFRWNMDSQLIFTPLWLSHHFLHCRIRSY